MDASLVDEPVDRYAAFGPQPARDWNTITTADPEPQYIDFRVNGDLMLQLSSDGNIYVQGRLATNDMEVVEGMRRFLQQSGHI